MQRLRQYPPYNAVRPIAIRILDRVITPAAPAGPDTTPPAFSTSEEGDVTNSTVAVLFSEPIVSPLTDYVTGVTIRINSVIQTINSGTRQANTALVYYVLASAADANDTITFAYSDILGDIQDIPGNQLGDVSATGVTNNVGTHYWGDNDADSMHMLLTMSL